MDIIESVVVPRQSGAVVRVPEGAALKITDLEGQQVSDMFAVFTDLSDFLGARTSRGANWRLFPEVGGRFISNNCRPMFLFEEDNSPGVHDLLAPPCSSEMYELFSIVSFSAVMSGLVVSVSRRVMREPVTVISSSWLSFASSAAVAVWKPVPARAAATAAWTRK